MKGVIESKKGDYFRCLLENGDILNLHSSEIASDTKVGDFILVSLSKEASQENKSLIIERRF